MMDHIDMRRMAEIAEAHDVRVVLTTRGFRIMATGPRHQVEHVLSYDVLWQARDPVGIFEQTVRRARRHLEDVGVTEGR